MNKIIGHDKTKKILNKILEEDKVGHAYLFTGKEGIGKKMLAIEFAKKVMNQEDCEMLNESDFKIVLPEKEIIKVEDIRNVITEVYLKPIYAKRKVVIIDDAEKMNTSAQNALLKVLEEPPLYATLILITSNREKIIKTILSRVTEIKFDALSNEELGKIVGNDIELNFARGSVSKALSLLEGDYYSITKELMDSFDNKSFIDINKKMSEIKSKESDIVKILEFLKVMYHNSLKNDTYRKVKIINLLDETIKNLKRNANADLTLDRLIIKVCEL